MGKKRYKPRVTQSSSQSIKVKPQRAGYGAAVIIISSFPKSEVLTISINYRHMCSAGYGLVILRDPIYQDWGAIHLVDVGLIEISVAAKVGKNRVLKGDTHENLQKV